MVCGAARGHSVRPAQSSRKCRRSTTVGGAGWNCGGASRTSGLAKAMPKRSWAPDPEERHVEAHTHALASGKEVASSKGVATQRYRAHGDMKPAQRFYMTATCPACGTNFSALVRLVYSLHNSAPPCLEWCRESEEPPDAGLLLGVTVTWLLLSAVPDQSRERQKWMVRRPAAWSGM